MLRWSLPGRVREALRGPERRAYLVLACAIVAAVALLLTQTWWHAATWDFRELERDPYDYGWQLQYAWRAVHGEWVGRGLHNFPRGPLWQLISLVAAGFSGNSPTRAMSGLYLVVPFFSLSLGLWMAWRSLERAGSRLLTFLVVSLVVAWDPVESLRTLAALVAIVLYARPLRAASSEPRWSDGVLGAVAAELALLLSFERGVIAAAALVVMAAYALVVRRLARLPLRPELRRAGAFAATLAALQLGVAGLAAAVGGSYLDYLRGAYRFSNSYVVSMTRSFAEAHTSAGSVYGFAIALVALALVFVLPKLRDLEAGLLLVGGLPGLITAIVRSDPPHVFMGLATPMLALVLVTLRQREVGRRGMFAASGVLSSIALLGWFGAHHAPLKDLWWSLPGHVRETLKGARADPDYRGDLASTVRWARRRVALEHPRCAVVDEALSAVYPLANLPGPIAVRWTYDLKQTRARTIERLRCPYYVYRLFSFDYGERFGSFILGSDFLAVARHYRPVQRITPDVYALRRRAVPVHEKAIPVEPPGIGRWRRVGLPGKLVLELPKPVPDTDLVRIEYTVKLPWLNKLLGGTPSLAIDDTLGDGPKLLRQYLTLAGVNRRVSQLIAVDPWTAEWRWIVGVKPHKSRSVDRLTLSLVPAGDWSPKSVRIEIHSVEVLEPPAVPELATPFIKQPNLIEALRDGRGYARYASPRFLPGGMRVAPDGDRRYHAALLYPMHVGMGTALHGFAELSMGSGAHIKVGTIDPQSRESRRAHLADYTLSAGSADAELDVPLDSAAGSNVFLQIQVDPGKKHTHDRVLFEHLELVHDTLPLTFAGALRGGRARAENSTPKILNGSNVLLHPNAPGKPPARVSLTFEPRADTCFFVGLRNAGPKGDGDGVWFDATVLDGASAVILFREHVLGGQPDRILPGFSLSHWAGRKVTLVLATRPGKDRAYDWAFFLHPRFGTGCRKADLTWALQDPDRLKARMPGPVSVDLVQLYAKGRAEVFDAHPKVEGHDLALPAAKAGTPHARVVFEVQPHAGDCLWTGLSHEGPKGDGVWFDASVLDGGHETSLLHEHLNPATCDLDPPPMPLGQWSGRAVKLVLETEPGKSYNYDWAYFVHPVVAACPKNVAPAAAAGP